MVSSEINNFISFLKPKQQEIIADRFGLKNGRIKTLAGIGDKYGITRERVRQIEEEALKKLKAEAQKSGLAQAVDGAIVHLDSVGGARRENIFLHEARYILGDENFHNLHLKLLNELFGSPCYWSEDKHFHPFWYSNDDILDRTAGLVKDTEDILSQKKEYVLTGNVHVYLIKIFRKYRIPDFIGINLLSLSKKFEMSPFGDLGLSSWEHINPKTVGSKAYVIVKKYDKPLHFREIAKLINNASFDSRKALPQTVHNELIKDPRFVLVGRGIYALKEQGFIPGTAREIIAYFLKENGPMSAEKIVREVSKQRILQRNTIILNLQNRKHFKRIDAGKYYIK